MWGFFIGERWNKWNADDADKTDWNKDLDQSGPQITQMTAIRTDWIAAETKINGTQMTQVGRPSVPVRTGIGTRI